MRKLLLGLLAIAAVTGPLAVTGAAHADPGSPGCMNKHEWSRIKEGMTRTRVTQVVGSAGHVTWSSLDGDGWSKDVDVNFRQCRRNGTPASSWSTVYMAFSNYDYDYPENDWHAMTLDYKGSWSTVS